MLQIPTDAQLAAIWGLVPRYMRERQAAEALAEANQPVLPPPPPMPAELRGATPRIDAVTSDLRCRIAAARPPRWQPMAMAAPACAGVSLALALLLST